MEIIGREPETCMQTMSFAMIIGTKLRVIRPKNLDLIHGGIKTFIFLQNT